MPHIALRLFQRHQRRYDRGGVTRSGADTDAMHRASTRWGCRFNFRLPRCAKAALRPRRSNSSVPEEHVHRHLPDVEAILAHGKLSESQRSLALRSPQARPWPRRQFMASPWKRSIFTRLAPSTVSPTSWPPPSVSIFLGSNGSPARSVPTGSGTVNAPHGLMPIPGPQRPSTQRRAAGGDRDQGRIDDADWGRHPRERRTRVD